MSALRFPLRLLPLLLAAALAGCRSLSCSKLLLACLPALPILVQKSGFDIDERCAVERRALVECATAAVSTFIHSLAHSLLLECYWGSMVLGLAGLHRQPSTAGLSCRQRPVHA